MRYIFAVMLVATVSLGVAFFSSGNSVAYADSCNGQSVFIPKWYDNLCSNGEIESPSDMGGGGDSESSTASGLSKWVSTLAINIVDIILTLVAYASLIFIIVGGFKYMTSGDSSGGTSSAKKTIMNAIIGLVISTMAVAIVSFVSAQIGGSGSSGSGTTTGTTT